jgi:DNA-directed RNA polymerase subunit M/transcription elongation factor TFIIS
MNSEFYEDEFEEELEDNFYVCKACGINIKDSMDIDPDTPFYFCIDCEDMLCNNCHKTGIIRCDECRQETDPQEISYEELNNDEDTCSDDNYIDVEQLSQEDTDVLYDE